MYSSLKTVRSGLICACSLISLLAATGLQAQVVERHLPEVPQGKSVPLATPNAVATEQDDTPIGPALRSIVVLGAQDTVRDTATGTEIAVARLKANQRKTEAALAPYIGKPLSRKLIAEVEAAIANRYRALGYPFVSLSTPEQEISSGVLQVRVVEFEAGDITVKGASDAAAEHIRAGVGLKSGDAIDTRALTYDMNWINKYPFRQVQSVFTPGATPGVTNLVLTATDAKPWQVYGGYSNAGSPATSFDRYFVGGSVGGLLGHDSVLSYQGTASRDLLAGEDNPHYQSHALSYSLPVGYRKAIEASLDQVETNQTVDPFGIRLKAVQGSLGYRFALADLYGDKGETDMRVGIEAKHQTGTTFFSGIDVYDVSMNVYQLYLGYHHNEADSLGLSDIDLSLHLSPGDVDDGNSQAQALLYSQGRLKDATYGYLSLNYNRLTTLPHELTLKTQVIGQYATGALPRTEQAGLGGAYLVRGYTMDDGAFDNALILRNALTLPGKALAANMHVAPYVFADVGYGEDVFLNKGLTIGSAGLGADVQLTRHIVLNLVVAGTLADGQDTRSGDVRGQTSLSFSF